jgi:hypothetical protein
MINERVRRTYAPGYEPRVLAPAALVRAYHAVVRPPRPLLGLLVLATLAALVVRVADRARAMPRLPEALLLTGMGLVILVAATATSGFIVRYLIPCVPLIVCGGTLALSDLLGRLASADGRRVAR